ncbi:hypothetical protein CYG68_17355 [Morganella morganii]|uniref:Uncharacterized protein n=1 Tax=Morganella morganii TaxID=582 RepID=A0A8I0PYS4_MORMO|nr:hypothetical protein [Morganella morganii]MBE8614145.1 hypothetical protein [Morganella morganii]
MSIGLTCFTNLPFVDLQKSLDGWHKQYSDIFPEHYYLSDAGISDHIDIEISNEFGLDPKSYFYMSVNNKYLIISTDKIAALVREELGKDNVVILLNGEDLI